MMSVSDAVEWVIGHVIVLTCGMKKADAGLHHPGGGGNIPKRLLFLHVLTLQCYLTFMLVKLRVVNP